MKTILLAEDDESAIALYEAVLSGHRDWRLVIARTGEEALQLAHLHLPAVALLDIQMPALDGIEVCRRLKSDPATAAIPVIVVSALTQLTSRDAAAEAGAEEFVAKPFSPAELTRLVERTLDSVR